MDKRFARLVNRLHPSFLKLKSCPPFSGTKGMPKRGVYLFSERGRPSYVGRSNNIANRYRSHRLGAGHNSASFAFILACKIYGRKKATYTTKGGRDDLMRKRKFRRAFAVAIRRIRAMKFRAVAEEDQTCQALLEVYCAVALKTQHNDFGTH